MEPLDLADAVRQTGKIPYDARPKELYEALISDEGTMYGGLLDQVEALQGALKDYALNSPGLADELRNGILEFADVAKQALRSLTKGQEQLEKLTYADEVADPKQKPEDDLNPEKDLKEKQGKRPASEMEGNWVTAQPPGKQIKILQASNHERWKDYRRDGGSGWRFCNENGTVLSSGWVWMGPDPPQTKDLVHLFDCSCGPIMLTGAAKEEGDE